MIRSCEAHADLFKALSDANRLRILDMLCRGELCACKILKKFNLSQPTLSHHMKILCDCGIIKKRKEGKWMYYSIITAKCKKAVLLLKKFSAAMENECHGSQECGNG